MRKTDAQVIADHSYGGAPSGCLIWVGATNKGYPKVFRRGRTMGGHRLAYEIANGPIPDGLVIDHLCRNPLCVNADHMEAVTIQINTLRGLSHTAVNAAKTHCKRGHEFTPENTGPVSGQPIGRNCRTCARIRGAARRAGVPLEVWIAQQNAPREQKDAA